MSSRDLLAQFHLLEDVLTAADITVWPMIEFEADDALAAGAATAARDKRVKQVIICTPDKDLAQSVTGTRVVQLHRRTNVTLDEIGVVRKFGVMPESIPDYLALVGDAADGYPGLRGSVVGADEERPASGERTAHAAETAGANRGNPGAGDAGLSATVARPFIGLENRRQGGPPSCSTRQVIVTDL